MKSWQAVSPKNKAKKKKKPECLQIYNFSESHQELQSQNNQRTQKLRKEQWVQGVTGCKHLLTGIDMKLLRSQ